MAFLWVALPSQLLRAQDIPVYDPPPPTDPTIRGGSCSSVVPNVLSPTLDKRILTTSAYPVLLFSVPTTSARQAEFVLKDSKKETIYRRTYNLAGKSGILRVTLPTDGSINELAVGQSYKWEFNLICEPANREHDDFVVGKLQRVSSNQCQKPVSQVSLWERYRALEYDGLAIVDAMRRANPTEQRLQVEWESWLERHNLGNLKKLPAIELK
ncbi:DUF928 domain-containing protein [Tumidithrix elongata RA019]|uniref:DUF928 domain-containing protein n=1 Tax=Tumidithrix elongata BACA0141 TaxID=2716417 RepID=A0AAW9Q724_9CYAN|nr:DUF928 domain-containing protein [Tumidithrix elongata RA019]